MHEAVLLDTSFFIRFLNDADPLFKNTDGYFRYFLEKEITMLISTISIAEYCVGGDYNELPLRNLQIIPFNLDHAKQAGAYAKICFKQKNNLRLDNRNIIPNDSKLFAQADIDKRISYYLSSDTSSYTLLKKEIKANFQFIDLHIPHHQTFGLLDL